MADIKGLLKLRNAAGGFDVIYPKTDAELVTLVDGRTVEAAIADAAQATSDAAQEAANAAQAAHDAADAAQADVDAVEKRLDDEGGLVDRLEAAEAFVAAQPGVDEAQDERIKALEDANAEGGAVKEAIDAVQDNLDKFVDETFEAYKKDAQDAVDAVQGELDKFVDETFEAYKKDAQDAVDAKVAQTEYDEKVADFEERIAANEAFVAAQPAVDEAQDERIKALEDANKDGGAVKEAIDAVQDNLDKFVDETFAAYKDEAKEAIDAAQADADALEKRLDDEGGLVDRLEAAEDFIANHSDEARDQQIADNKAALEVVQGDENVDGSIAKALKDAKEYAKEQADGKDEAIKAAHDAADAAQADVDAIHEGKNKANGFVELDADGLVPSSFIPAEFKEIKVVANLDERNALANPFSGLSVFVKDASEDESVNSGGAYYLYDGENWIKTAEVESLDVVLNWSAIQGKPTTLAGYGITDAVNVSEVVATATANKILKLNADGQLPADVTGNAATASKLQIAANIGIEGDDVVAADVAFDGSEDVRINVVLSETGVAAGTYAKVTVDAKGRVTAGTALVAEDIPELDWAKIATGKPTTLAGYGITDAVNKAGDVMTGALTLSGAPTADLHAATKAYVDSVVQGLDVKASVKCATTANIVLSGTQTIDGVAVAVGDRVLVKNQENAVDNGIYVVAEGAWERAEDAVAGKVNSGMFTFVEEGDINANGGFVLATDGNIAVGTTELEFVQFSGMGQVIAGYGIGKNGNEVFLADSGVAAGTYTKVTVDAKGRVVSATNLSSEDLPEVAWAVITGKPDSAVADIDDAVAKRHAHANAAQLDKIGEADGVLTYGGVAMATQGYVQSLIQISDVEPANLPVGGLWIEVVQDEQAE